MSKPTAREIRAVSLVSVLEEYEVSALYQILQTLGFDVETIALFWERPVADVKALLRVDMTGPRKPLEPRLTGADLAWFCELIHVRPGAIQQRINFDESPRGKRKVGRSSSRVPIPWVGPPICCIKGAAGEGRVYVELASQVTVPMRSQFNSFVLSQISVGKFPLRLQALRDVVAAAEEADVTHPKMNLLQAAMAAFPPGVRTVDEAFDALTTSNETHVTIQEDESMKADVTAQFRHESVTRGISNAFLSLHAASADFRSLCALVEVVIPPNGRSVTIYPGHLEAIVVSNKWQEIRLLHQALTQPLQDLYSWLQTERVKGSHPGSKATSHQWPSASLYPAENTSVTRVVASLPPPATLVRAIITTPARTPPKEEVVPVPEPLEFDSYGVIWDWGKRVVIIGALSLPMNASQGVLANSSVSLTQRVYRSLKELREKLGVRDWQVFARQLVRDSRFVAGLFDGTSVVTPAVVKNILEGLQHEHSLTLTPSQLFRLEAWPQFEVVAESAAVPDVPLLFEKGDLRIGYMWGSLLRKYGAVLRWFRTEYGITDEQIAVIEKGNLGVPVSVHLILMQKVTERLANVTDPVVPRSFTRLMELPVSEPVRRGTFDQTQIPHKDWFRNQ